MAVLWRLRQASGEFREELRFMRMSQESPEQTTAIRVSDRGRLAEVLRVVNTMPGVRTALAAAPVLATILVLSTISGAPSPGDLRIGQALQDTPGGAVLAGIAVALAFPGVQFVVWFAGLLAAIRTRNLPLVVAAFLVVIALGVNPLLKELIARPRPNADELIIRRAASGYGFPSGHTQDATQIYGLQPSRLPRSAACSGRAL